MLEIRSDRYCPHPITSTDHLLLYLIEEVMLLREQLATPELEEVKAEEVKTPVVATTTSTDIKDAVPTDSKKKKEDSKEG